MKIHTRNNNECAFCGQHMCGAHEEHSSCSQLVVPYMHNTQLQCQLCLQNSQNEVTTHRNDLQHLFYSEFIIARVHNREESV